MKAKIILPIFFLMIFSLSVFVSATSHIITITGEPRTPDNKIDLMYDAGIGSEQGKATAEVEINNDNGFFKVKDYSFDDTINVNGMELVNSVNVFAAGSCFYHSYNIKWQNNQYEVFDAYSSDEKIILSTKENNINLGTLKEDKSNQIMVDSDVPVSFQAFDMNNNEVALNTGYKEFTGMSNSFNSNSRYKIVIQDEKGNKWEKVVTTGSYCESTRIIKRKNLMIEEHFPNNSFPKIGFFRNIGLWFKSIFS